MEITLRLLDESVSEKLFKFELENKSFFEKVGLSRGENYYDFNNFKTMMKEIIVEQERDLLYMYLIENSCGNIVGRVNLVSVIRGNLNKAEIGYRIGEQYQGRGYATSAVKLVLEKALNQHKLHRVEAGTATDNMGSQIVLIKNGFQFVGRYNQYIHQNGRWHDSLSFEKILD